MSFLCLQNINIVHSITTEILAHRPPHCTLSLENIVLSIESSQKFSPIGLLTASARLATARPPIQNLRSPPQSAAMTDTTTDSDPCWEAILKRWQNDRVLICPLASTQSRKTSETELHANAAQVLHDIDDRYESARYPTAFTIRNDIVSKLKDLVDAASSGPHDQPLMVIMLSVLRKMCNESVAGSERITASCGRTSRLQMLRAELEKISKLADVSNAEYCEAGELGPCQLLKVLFEHGFEVSFG